MSILQNIETNYFFQIMSGLAAAKVDADATAIADCISDLEMIGLHSKHAVIAHRARVEAERASAFLSELQAKRLGYAGAPALVLTRVDYAANLN